MLKQSDLINGKIYYNEGFGKKYIFMFNNKEKYTDTSNHIYFYNSKDITYHRSGSFGDKEIIKNLRPASSVEKVWLEECIKHNKFIPLSKIKTKLIYQIY